MFIFVYGTLRRGGSLNYKIQDLKEPVGVFHTLPKYTLYDMRCPCLARGGGTSVVGEVYEIQDLEEIADIHSMEVHAGYTLEQVELEGFSEEVHAYFQAPEPSWGNNIIDSGDYIRYKLNRYEENQ